MILSLVTSNTIPAVVYYAVCLTLSAPTADDVSMDKPVPVLDVIQLYGRLAGPTCFGKAAPPGASCQITRSEWERMGLDNLDKARFAAQIQRLDFQWPLKPYGVDAASATKTAVMNKGVETRLYMDELEARGLLDRRNPTGPLPTSLRPALNRLLQSQGVSEAAMDLLWRRLETSTVNQKDVLSGEALLFQSKDAIDWYDFLEFMGRTSVTWDERDLP